eukprot:CAMPEP_0173199822 /NCGR_PEP_ID=MMETSP1141-20130122/17446_1 /TAXON_ID=483371 /ORGANISM="non described non described, Strain CCMP2298" /LENGTH=116 /DNA_ID=CAMNT_0014124749 /DNA_START=182 /DNA_END=532 /DNA_ORIENTATION=+
MTGAARVMRRPIGGCGGATSGRRSGGLVLVVDAQQVLHHAVARVAHHLQTPEGVLQSLAQPQRHGLQYVAREDAGLAYSAQQGGGAAQAVRALAAHVAQEVARGAHPRQRLRGVGG